MSSRASPAASERGFKGAVTGKSRRKATIRGYLAGTEPVVEVRVLHERDQGVSIDLTLSQARQTIRLLLDAIEGAAELARADGNSATAHDRASSAGDATHAGRRAKA